MLHKFAFLVLVLFSPALVHAASFSSEYEQVRRDKNIQCQQQKFEKGYKKYGMKVGSLWVCKERNDSVQLYISEQDDHPGHLKRIYLKTERANGQEFTGRQRMLVQAVLKHYEPQHYKALAADLLSCKKKSWSSASYRYEFDCYSGATIRSNTVFLYPLR